MIEQLQKRDRVLALKEEKREKAAIKAKQQAELAEKKQASDANAEEEAAARNREVKDKKDQLEEVKAKSAAAAEVKVLNRDIVMRKARTAMDASRHAARMARMLIRSTSRNVDDARLKAAKENANQDIAALAKLRHHEDLASDAVNSADEKKEKIAQFEFSAKDHLSAAEDRMAVVKKRNRWDARHAETLRNLAMNARDKAQLLKAEAGRQAARANMPEPDIPLPPAPKHVPLSVTKIPSPAQVERAEETAEQAKEAVDTTTETANEDTAAAEEPEAEKADPVKVEEKKEVVEEQLSKAGVTKENSEPEKVIEATGMRPAGAEKKEGSSEKGHADREKIRERTERVASEIKAEIEKTKKSAAEEAAGGVSNQEAEAASTMSKQISKAVDADNAVAEKQIAKDKKVAEGLTPGESKKTAATKIQAAAAEAVLKSSLAQAKLAKAKMLRKEARKDLKKQGKPIPAALTKKALKPTQDKADAAQQEAAAAAEAAKATTEQVKKEVKEEAEKPAEIQWSWF